MLNRTPIFVLATLLMAISSASGGTIYKVTCHDGGKTITYQVQFGGEKLRDRFTAFDPESKKFVYLTWSRKDKPPTPAMRLWDHRTGEIIPLYRFPDAKNPLPVIPSIEAMKVCPFTSDKNFKVKVYAFDD